MRQIKKRLAERAPAGKLNHHLNSEASDAQLQKIAAMAVLRRRIAMAAIF